MSKTKLLFRNRSMELGGVERLLVSLLKALDKDKYEIVLLLNYERGEFLNQIPKEVKVISIAGGLSELSDLRISRPFQKAIQRIKFHGFRKSMKSFYQKHDLMDVGVEIAFSHNVYSDVLASPNKKSRKISWFHGNLVNFWLSENQKLKLIDQLNQFDRSVFVSEHSKESIEEHWKISLKKAVVIDNLLSIDEIIEKSKQKPEKDFGKVNFLAVGRLQKNKGFADLINAHARLTKEGYEIKTLVLGEGYQYAELEKMIADNRISDSFILGGYQSNPYPYFKTTDCVVLSSYTEGYSLVVAEALLLNLPVIATRVGVVEELVQNEKYGQIIEPGVENLYQKMKELLDGKFDFSRDSSEYIIQKNKAVIQKLESLFG